MPAATAMRKGRAAKVPVIVTLGGGYSANVVEVVGIHCNTVMAALRHALPVIPVCDVRCSRWLFPFFLLTRCTPCITLAA